MRSIAASNSQPQLTVVPVKRCGLEIGVRDFGGSKKALRRHFSDCEVALRSELGRKIEVLKSLAEPLNPESDFETQDSKQRGGSKGCRDGDIDDPLH
jgi:hypothetical protein